MNRLGYCLTLHAMLCAVVVSVTSGPLQAAISLGEPRPLSTAIDRSEKPAVSPDGTRVAFVSNRSGADNIWVTTLDGEPVQLTQETRPEIQTTNPRWSPAGDFLVYTSNKGGTGSFDLWVISADGQRDEPLTVDPALDWMPAWSPDGKRIAFVSDRDGADGLWLTNLDGSGVTKIAELAYEPAWSPDGSQIAAYHIEGQADGVFLISPDGQAPPRLVLESGRMPTWSSDCRYIVAVRSDETGERLWLADLQNDSTRPIGPATEGLAWPSWGSRGPIIVYETSRGGQKQVMVSEVTETRPIAAILDPVPGQAVRGAVTVTGRLGGEGVTIATWRLESGAGASPRSWTLIAEGSGSVDGELTTWKTAGLEGVHTLRLTAISDTGETTVSAVPVSIFGQYGVVWERHDIPLTMTTSGLYEAAVVARNSGTMTWRNEGPFAVYGSYQWVDQNGRVVVAEGLHTPLPDDVAPEESVALTARIAAPPTGGNYTLRYDLRQGGQVWFNEQGGQPLDLAVSVAVPYAFTTVIPSAPSVMVPGQIYTVEVRVQNTGSITWRGLAGAANPAAQNVMLTARWRDLAGGLVDAQPLLTPLPHNVAPGETAVVMARVQAPAVNGSYRLLFDLRDEKGLFSERMGREPNGVDVAVSSPYGVEFLDHNTPGRMFPGEIQSVGLQMRNTGSLKWRADGPQPLRLSYTWLDRSGMPQSISPIETDLPYDVLPGMTAAVTARLQAPGEPGEYVLQWDLAQPGGRRLAELGNVPLRVSVMVGAPTHSVRWEQIQHPVEMVVGALYTVELRLTNTGAMTWSPEGRDGVRLGYHWVRPNGEEIARAPLFTELPNAVNQGESVRFTARVQAPERAGRYMLRWDLYQGGYDFFSTRGAATLDIPINVQVIYGAEFLSHDTPTRLVAGQRYRVNLRIRNTGTIPWEAGGTVPVVLGYRWYNAAGDEVTGAQQVRSPLPRTVQPNESVEIAAWLEAPAEGGRYDLEWDLLFAAAFWFSEKGVQPLRVPVLVE